MVNTMPVKIYLFDFDDTIISTKIYAKIYLPILTLVKTKFNWTNKQLEQKAKELGLGKNKFGRWDTGDLCRELGLLEEYYALLEKHLKVVPVLYKNTILMFKKIKKKKKKIGIISNSMLRTITMYLNRYQLHHYIDFVFSRDDASHQKQEAAYWKKLIKKHKLKPTECLVIGDDLEQDKIMPEKFRFRTLLLKKPEDINKLTFH